MTLYHTAREAVGGNPEELLQQADVLAAGADSADEIATSLRRSAEATDTVWGGAAGDAYRAHAATQVGVLARLPSPLTSGSAAFRALGNELAAAQSKAGNAMQRSVELGMRSGDLVGRPGAVAVFALTHPVHMPAVALLLGDVAGARSEANEARNRFVASMGVLRADLSAASIGFGRNPDERGGRRIRNDEIFRRSEGGDRGGDHFDNDWAGRAILERYLRGGDDWTITNDDDWSRYMMNNQLLREQLTGPAQEAAQGALDQYLGGNGPDGSFDQRFHAEIENGEGIVGYQYLHGTDSDAGGFQFRGDTHVEPLPDGHYRVTIDGNYTWNDTIDPNPQYETDTWKSRLAEVLTLGQADPYRIHVNWSAGTQVTLDRSGNVIGISGYPAP